MIELLLGAKRVAPAPPEKDLTGTYTLRKAGANTGYSYLAASSIDNEIYIFGGLLNNVAQGRLIKYNPATGVVTTLASGIARVESACTAYNGKLYVFGGRTGTAGLNTAQVYDPRTNAWTTLTTMPGVSYGNGVFIYNKKIYVVSGYTGSANVASMYVYDPALNTWATIAIASTTNRAYRAADGFINNLYYLVGGQGANTTTTRIYNPVTNTWTTGAALPAGRNCCGVQEHNGKLLVYGGYNDGLLGMGIASQDTLYTYNPTTNTWTTGTGPKAAATDPMVQCYGVVYYVGEDVYSLT